MNGGSGSLSNGRERKRRQSLSVIVPTLNEGQNIVATLERDEVIVVDCGSSDTTATLAIELGAQVILSKRGRGHQLNRGAHIAKGDFLLFLHADAILPLKAGRLLEEAFEHNPAQEWGCFQTISLQAPGLAPRLISWGVIMRTWLFSLPYGDQALFVQNSAFRAMGGFKETLLMEDIDLVVRLRQAFGPPCILAASIRVSARRWLRLGYLRTTLLNWMLVIRWYLGSNPDSLAAIYYGAKPSQFSLSRRYAQ